jgi:hypothetical protein
MVASADSILMTQINPGEQTMADPIDTQILKLNQPGVVIEVDRRTAEDLGAFEEDALDEAEALASADTDGQDVH